MDLRQEATGSNGSEAQKNSKLKEKIQCIIKNVTVEPLLILYFMPLLFSSFAIENLNLEKACRVNLAYNSTVCDALTARNTSEFEEEDIKVQSVITSMIRWKNILRYSVPAILIIFIGSWSDRTSKRKPLLLLPIFGELLTTFGLLLCTYYYLEWPVEVAGVIEGLFPAITGSNMMLAMAVYSYISDITKAEDRTFRIGMIGMIALLSSSAGIVVGGILLKKVTFYGMFSISAVLYILGLIYCWFYVKEIQKDIIPSTERNKKNILYVFDLLSGTLLIILKRRANYQRIALCLVMCAFIAVAGPPFGETGVAYLFMRRQLNWDEKDAGYLGTYSTLITFAGTLFTVSVLSKILKLNDCLIGIIVMISRGMAAFCYAFSYKGWQLYLAQTIDILSGSGLIPVRSIVSKIVPPDEIGRIFSLMGICEGVTTATFGPLYASVYEATVEKFPGAVFLVGTIFTLTAGSIFITIYILSRRGKVYLDEHSVDLEAAKNDQTTKEQHVNKAFETEEEEAIDSKL